VTSDPLIGANLGNFRIERLIGRGGMASVYYGWDAKLQRPAAVKAIDISQRDIAYAKRLVQEARIIARWRHEHICQVYTADRKDNLYFFAMEFIDGLDLGELMGRYHEAGELIPHADAVRIGRAVASALDFAHQRGVIHRDVKPSNIMLDGDGRIVLMDFGLALDVQQGTMGEVLGTPHYVAPEQAQDSAQTVPQSDLYALGVILYEMLTGSVPFDDPSPMSLALKHITSDPPLPTSVNPLLNIPIEAVLLKAMSKRPQDRYGSGEGLMDAVEAALGHAHAADARLRTPVANWLVVHARQRVTQPARGADEQDSAPVTVRHARQKAARRQNTRLLALAGGAVGIVAVAGLAIVLASGLLNSASPAAPAAPSPVDDQTPDIIIPAATPPVSEPAVIAPVPPTTDPGGLAAPGATLSPAQPTTITMGGYPILLLYTDRGFYLFNTGAQNIETINFAFEALDSATGQPAGWSFNGKSWADYYPIVEQRNCVIVEIVGASAFRARPPECASFNAQRTPNADSSEIFWIARPGVADFRALWAGQEIARCAIVSGRCEVYLP